MIVNPPRSPPPQSARILTREQRTEEIFLVLVVMFIEQIQRTIRKRLRGKSRWNSKRWHPLTSRLNPNRHTTVGPIFIHLRCAVHYTIVMYSSPHLVTEWNSRRIRRNIPICCPTHIPLISTHAAVPEINWRISDIVLSINRMDHALRHL